MPKHCLSSDSLITLEPHTLELRSQQRTLLSPGSVTFLVSIYVPLLRGTELKTTASDGQLAILTSLHYAKASLNTATGSCVRDLQPRVR